MTLAEHRAWCDDPATGRRIVWADLTERERADLRRASLGGGSLRRPLLRDADLRNADLGNAALREADLRQASLTNAAMTGADLSYADLREADLRRASLREAAMTGADLRRADLTTADMTDADMTDADLRRADLTDAILTGTNAATWSGYRECATLVPSSDPQDPILAYGGERHTLSVWRVRVRELCERYHPGEADSYEREIRDLIALAEAVPPPSRQQPGRQT